MTAPLLFTEFSSFSPARLAKKFSLSQDGMLVKEAVAHMVRGEAIRKELTGLQEFGPYVEALAENQALSFGVTQVAKAAVVTKSEQQKYPEAIARSREFFEFAPRPGIWMLDNDGQRGGELSIGEFRERVIEVCPTLAEAQMVWRPSSSSCIVNAAGDPLTGLCGQRLYIAVANAADIPRAGKCLFERMWAAGFGYIKASAAGTALERTLVDGGVWQPERLDFTASPILMNDLRRNAPPSQFFGDPSRLYDLREIVDDSEVFRIAARAKQSAREKAKPDLDARREEWITMRSPQLAESRKIDIENARDVLYRACTQQVLTGDFILFCADGSEVSVADLLDAPEHWHAQRFRDPLEPGIPDHRIAWANLRSGGQPYVFSHAHGGMRYFLARAASRIRTGRGLRIEATDNTIAVLRARRELYDYGEGGALARISNRRIAVVTPDWLLDYVGRAAQYFTTRVLSDGSVKEDNCDAQMPVVRAIIAKAGECGFPTIVAITTAPTLSCDGAILDTPGFDPESGLLFICGEEVAPRVPRCPTIQEAVEATRKLLDLIKHFPLVDAVDWGVVLQAMLTACMRASLPSAPGVGLDAPTPGNGKTLLARVIGILKDGDEPAILPPADNDDEFRKRIFALLRDNASVLLLDNQREPLNLPSLDAFLTASRFSDRVLGVSETATVPNRALFLVTGNNLRLAQDTSRRVLVVRMDSRLERPFAREFEFCPAQRVRSRRIEYVIAALTIIRAHITAGRPRVAAGRAASFEIWDDLVRQPVCWIAQYLPDDLPAISDPLSAADRAFLLDPTTQKLRSLLEAWHADFRSLPVTVATVVDRAGQGDRPDLLAVLEEIAGQGSVINRRILGRFVERHAGQRMGGLWIERGKLSHGLQTWRVECESPPAESQDSRSTFRTMQSDKVGLGGFGGSVSVSFASESGIPPSPDGIDVEV